MSAPATSGELFAGVGGLGMAVDEVFSTEPAWFCEFDAAPSKVLAYHYPDVPNFGDVTKLIDPPRVSVLAGGFPCQDVSLAGRRRGLKDGTRSGLWSEFARLIDSIRPDWVVIENVRGLLSADASGSDVESCPWCLGDDGGVHHLRALGAVLGDLAELGFDAEWVGLRAADVGAPHGRFRVFILAWPSENTGRSGSGGLAEGQEPSRGDDAPVGSDQGGDGGRADRDLTRAEVFAGDWGDWPLLPTPVAQPSGNSPEDHLRKKPGREVVTDLAIIAENGLIASGGRLLPTPGAYDGERGGSQHPDKRRDGGHSVTIQDVAENLMPTPRAAASRTSRGAMLGSSSGPSLEQAAEIAVGITPREVTDGAPPSWHLLPTPQVADSTGGHATRSGARSDELLLPGAAVEYATNWGPYEAAIRRWESIIGRPAPAPVRMDGKGGKARLNPALCEFMMGWPEGWVTAPEIDLTRAEQLKGCGNGVVTLQAVAALRELTSRPGVPPINWAVAA